ncbi:MAG TPA: hypothetical protein VF451_05230 [Acidobacteriota bacterium]
MKKAVFLIWLILLLGPGPFKASALEQNPSGAPPPAPSAAPQKIAPYADGEDDIFSSTYERELLSRRFFQKTLPPLKRREKIVWSFKTARANLLL